MASGELSLSSSLELQEFQLVLSKSKKLSKEEIRRGKLHSLGVRPRVSWLLEDPCLSLASFPFPICANTHGEDLPEEQDEG